MKQAVSPSLDALFRPAPHELAPAAAAPLRRKVSLKFEDEGGASDFLDAEPARTAIPDRARTLGAAVLSGTLARFAPRIGRAAHEALHATLSASVDGLLRRYAAQEPDPSLQRRLRVVVGGRAAQLLNSVGWTQLGRELTDQRRRDAIEKNDTLLARFLGLWRKRIGGLQLAFPQLWYVPGLTQDELLEHFELRLVEAVRGQSRRSLESFAAVGEEATFRFLARQKDYLRKKRQLFVVPDQYSATLIQAHVPAPDERLLADQGAVRATELMRAIGTKLSPRQLQWYFQFLKDFNAHDAINLARCAAVFGKNRSSALRQIQTLRARLLELGAGELVDILATTEK